MDRYSVFVPKLLPSDEPFVAEGRSCPGCGQASAVRLIGKAMEDRGLSPYGETRIGLHDSSLPYGQWGFQRQEKQCAKQGKADAGRIAVMAGESGSLKDGLSLLKDAKAKGRPFLYICFLNEAGVERHKVSSSSGYGPDSTKNFIDRFRDMHLLAGRARALKPDYMATACPAYPFDLIGKVKKALASGGTGFIAVLAPCPSGCFYDPSLGLSSGRLAVETGLFPLYQIENNKIEVTVRIETAPKVMEYMKMQPLFALTEADEMEEVQKEVGRISRKIGLK